MAKSDFNIIIMHGRANHYKTVQKHIKMLGYNPIVLKEHYTGQLLLQKVQEAVWDKVHCAIIIMSPDDVVGATMERRARQNVVFELGYCMGAFDSIPDKYAYNSVIILKEISVADFSDIHGLEVIEYTKSPNESVLENLKQVLKSTFKKAKKYYTYLKNE